MRKKPTMRKINCITDCREEPYGLPVRTLIKDVVRLGAVDIEVRIGPVAGESEYVVLTRLPGQRAWSESWRLGELLGFKEEFARHSQQIHYQRYLAAIDGLVTRAARIEGAMGRKAA